jgi:hypothetical protein
MVNTPESNPGRDALVKFYISQFENGNLSSRDFIDNLTFLTDHAWWRKNLTLFELYRKVLHLHGDVWICGARWGNQLPLFSEFRELLEPQNYWRTITGFDTFTGFPDGNRLDSEKFSDTGFFGIPESWLEKLPALASAHSKTMFNGSYRIDVVKGDALLTIPEYLKSHPQTLLSLVYMDFDLHEPTLATLESIYPRLIKGSIVIFDELNDITFPGETVAMLEFFDALGIKPEVQRLPYSELISYITIE